MPIPGSIADLSQTPGNNYPTGSESPITFDNYLREYASHIAMLRDAKNFTNPAALASATTTDIGAQNSMFVEITGTTTITGFGTTYNGPRFLRFTGILTLTHNATSLNLPTSANITTAAGDTAIAVPNSTPNGWNVVHYQRANGTTLALSSGAGADIASAATLNLTARTGNVVRITGTTPTDTITLETGGVVFCIAAAAWPLTYHATTNPVQGGESYTCEAGDIVVYMKDGSDVLHNWVIKNNGRAVVEPLTSVRQTVISGPVDSNGLPSFGGSTGSTTVTASGTLVVTAANGTNDRVGSITNPSWTSVTANAYATLTVNADGTCTPNVRTLAPVEQFGGTPSTTSGQLTFNISEMKMYLGNGTTADEVYEVVVGSFTASGTVSAITWFALNGQYIGPWTATLPGVSTQVSANHNIGASTVNAVFEAEVTTADSNFTVGKRIDFLINADSGVVFPMACVTTPTVVTTVTGGSGIRLQDPATGTIFSPTLSSYKRRFRVWRAWR